MHPLSPNPRQLSRYVEHRCAIFYPKSDEPVRKLRHEIIERTAATGEKLIYRYSTKPGLDVTMLVEEQATIRANVAVPTCFSSLGRDDKGTYHVLLPAEGLSLADHTPEVRQQAYADLGRRLHSLHTVTFPFPPRGAGFIYPSNTQLCGVHPRWSDHLRSCLTVHSEACGVPLGTVSDLISQLAAIEHTIPMALLHADLSDHNLFTNDEGTITAFIDWEDALIGDPLYDLADWATFHDEHEDLWPILFGAYFAGGRKPWDFQFRFWVYYLRISLSKLVQHKLYQVPDVTRSEKRVKRAMEELGL